MSKTPFEFGSILCCIVYRDIFLKGTRAKKLFGAHLKVPGAHLKVIANLPYIRLTTKFISV